MFHNPHTLGGSLRPGRSHKRTGDRRPALFRFPLLSGRTPASLRNRGAQAFGQGVDFHVEAGGIAQPS